MCAPGAAQAGIAVAQAGIGYLGAREQTNNQNSVIGYQNRAIRRGNFARLNAYNDTIERQDKEWGNTLNIWNKKLEQFDKQIERNQDAAYGMGGAFQGLQVRTNEAFTEAAFANQASFVKLAETLGYGAATGQTGRSVDRFDVASLAAFGREQAIRANNLTRTIDAQKLDQFNVNRQLESANNQAWQQVAVAPIAPRRPQAPVYQDYRPNISAPSPLPFIGQAAIGAFSGLGSAGALGKGIQNSFLPQLAGIENSVNPFGVR